MVEVVTKIRFALRAPDGGDDPVRIIHAVASFYPVIGGIENVVLNIAKAQARMGHEVRVITSKYGSEGRPACEFLEDIGVIRLKTLDVRPPNVSIPLFVPRHLLRWADVIQGYSQNSFFAYVICKEAKGSGKLVSFYYLGVDYYKHHPRLWIRLLGYPYQRWLTKRVSRIADIHLVPNVLDMRILRTKYGVFPVLVPHGIDEKYRTLPSLAEFFRRKYAIDRHLRIVAYVGRVHSTKGVDLLIEAFAAVKERLPDTLLVIAGKEDPRYASYCRRLAEQLGLRNRVLFLGFVSEEDKIGLIDASEVVVIPSRHRGESYSLVLEESRSRGKPVIVTRVGILPFRVNDGVDGFVVPPEDPTSLSEALISVLENPLKPPPPPDIATWPEIAKKLLSIYEQHLAR